MATITGDADWAKQLRADAKALRERGKYEQAARLDEEAKNLEDAHSEGVDKIETALRK